MRFNRECDGTVIDSSSMDCMANSTASKRWAFLGFFTLVFWFDLVSRQAFAQEITQASASDTMTKREAVAESQKKIAGQLTPNQLQQWTWPHEPLELLAVRKQSSFVTCMATIPNEKNFLLAGREVTLWSAHKNKPEHVFDWTWIPNTYMIAIAVSPDGKWFVTADVLGKLYRWELASRKLTKVKDIGMFDIADLAISADGKEIAVLRCKLGEGVVALVDSQNFALKSNFSIDKDKNDKFRIDKWGNIQIFSADYADRLNLQVSNRLEYIDNNRLVTMGRGTSIWNTATGELERDINRLEPVVIGSVKDGNRLFTANSKYLQVWNKPGMSLASTLENSFYRNELLTFSPNGRYFANLNELALRIWDSQSSQCVQTIRVDIDRENKSVGMEWLAEENVLVVVEQHGAIRIWGTRSEGEKLDLIPKSAPKHESETKLVFDRIPATSIEAQSVLDFGQIPYPKGSKMVYSTLEAFSCESPLDMKEAKLFFRYHFSRLGWLEHLNPNSDTIEFRKDDFMMTAKFESKATGKTQIWLSYGSNYDIRQAPRLKVGDIQVDFESANSVIYRTHANLLTIECGLIRLMKESGWVLFGSISNGPDKPTDHFSNVKTPERLLTFLKDGVVLGIAIDQSPNEQVPSTIEYAKWLSEYSVPFPSGVTFVEFDFRNRCSFAAVAWMKSVDLKAFYDRELVRQGWTALPSQPSPYRDHYAQTYIRGQRDLTLTFRQHLNDKSVVFAYGGQNTWQMTKLMFEGSKEEIKSTVDKYMSYVEWLDKQSYTKDYDSIDRYESEMKAFLAVRP